MLTGLKVSSLQCKCITKRGHMNILQKREPMELNFEGSFVIFSANESMKSVQVLAKYLSTSERSFLVLSENVMNHWILSYHKQNINC